MATLAISTSTNAPVDVSIAACGRPYRLPSTVHHLLSTIQRPTSTPLSNPSATYAIHKVVTNKRRLL